ncbi:MAG: AraC family transcriptional regulator [Bacteroidetes bacterium]|nr:AraC family transcriptional regulator [Bacteroidota bacterium]
MSLIPYIEYTRIEATQHNLNTWYHMSHLSNACASEDAHRTSAYAICLLSEGELQLESDLFVHKAKAPAVFTIAPAAIRKFTDLGTPYDAQILFFRKEVFLEGQTDITYLDKFDFFEKTGQQVVNLNAEQFSQFKSYFKLIHIKTTENAPHTSAIIRSLIYIILNEIEDAHQKQNPADASETDKNTNILTQFKSLLSEHFIQEREVSFYADKLHLTPKYFSTVIKKISGKTAGSWINDMVLLESKVRLLNHEQSISQIAYDLNFSDPSHFGKFFKKHTGLSPMEYRNQVK